MAIIYTYPPVTDPDGTELIVVSETKNKNSTRLITLAGICAFCDETSCDHSFKYIETSSIIPAEADGCDDVLELISSDATITITNVGNKIDFVSTASCPTTYVIKPVICEGIECTISNKLEQWVWTCDETLGALAPGYISSFALNGAPIPHPEPSATECWYIDTATLTASATTCDTCCGGTTPTYSWVDCADSFSYVTVGVDPGIVIGKTSSVCCDAATPSQTTKCWEYVGDVGQPIGGTFDPCIYIDTHDNCDCCTNRCNYTYQACIGASGGFPATLTFNLGMDETTVCECFAPQVDIVVEDGAGNFWCYNSPELNCLPADDGYTILGVPDAPCEDPVYCPPVTTTYKWSDCAGILDDVIEAVDPGVAIGFTKRFCCAGEPSLEYCFTYEGPVAEPIGGTFPLCDLQGDEYDDCECCVNHCNFEYTACDPVPAGFPATTVISMGIEDFGCECNTEPSSIVIEIGGETWCYDTPVSTCENAGAYPILFEDPGCNNPTYCPDPASITYVKYDYCNDPTGDKWASSLGSPGIELISVGTVFEYLGSCYEVLENPSTINPLTEVPGFVAWEVSGEKGCDCCELPYREYVACIDGNPNIILDPTSWPTLNPIGVDDDIRVEFGVNPGVWECYSWEQCTSDVVTAGISQVEISSGCDDDECDILVQLTDCTGTYTQTVALGDLAPDISGENPGDVINVTGGALAAIGITTCWTIDNLNAPGPIDVVGVTTWEGPIAGGGTPTTTPCMCCEMDLRTYNLCDLGVGTCADAPQAPSIIIDMAGVAGPPTHIIATETLTGQDCCYELDPVLPACTDPTGTYIDPNVIDDCADAVCPGL